MRGLLLGRFVVSRRLELDGRSVLVRRLELDVGSVADRGPSAAFAAAERQFFCLVEVDLDGLESAARMGVVASRFLGGATAVTPAVHARTEDDYLGP